MQQIDRLGRVAAGGLVAATLMFFIGATAERLSAAAQPMVTAVQPTAAAHSESAEQVACERAGGSEESCAKTAASSAPGGQVGEAVGESQEGSPEREAAERAAGVQEATILGLSVESLPVIGFVVVLSLILAAALWFRPRALSILLVAVVFALVTGAFDLREIPFQLARSNTPLVGLALGAGVLHVAVAGVAGAAAFMARRVSPRVISAREGQRASAR